MIDGLKLTMTGEHLVAKLNERIADHERDGRAHKSAAKRAKADGRGEVEELVDDGEITRSARQIEVLTLIRDHIVLDEVYRLGEYDLKFADLLPEEEWLDCGCLGRWRHTNEEEETMEELRSLGAGAAAGAGSP